MLVRRYFLVAVPIVVAAEIVAILTGAGHRPLWLIAPLLLALVGGGLALARGVPAAQTARIVDTGLELHERLGTALEIEDTTPVPEGLAALVVDEAKTALGTSLGTAHPVGRQSRAEWTWVLAGVVAVAMAAAVPGVGHSGAGSRGHALGAASGQPRGHGERATASRRAAGSRAPGSPHGAPFLPSGLSFTAGRVNTNPRAAPRDDYSIYGNGGHASAAQLSQLAREGLTGARLAAVGGSTARAGAGAGGSGGSSPSDALGGQAGFHSAATATGGDLPAPIARAQAQTGAARPGTNSGSTPGHAGARSSAGSGYSRSTAGGPPGGESAGDTRAALGLGLGLVPDLVAGSRLPLQAGFTQSRSSRSSAHEGISQTPNGGGGPGRTTQIGGGTGGSAGSATSFAVIPPTPNSASTAVQSLLQNYFGAANQLSFDGW